MHTQMKRIDMKWYR